MPNPFDRLSRPRRSSSGQSVVEFALVVPFLLMLVVAIADFSRLYSSMVAIESAAREAADYGAFQTNRWDPANVATTVAEMERRACVAAAGSHLQDYVSSDPIGNTTCSNPTFACWLELSGTQAPCASSNGAVGTTDCSSSLTEPPCTVHVRMDYSFRTILQLPPLPATVGVTRDSRFRISDLAPPP
jgi:Na+-transporting methylmalonyl-CoA/oxaloacetate decarboxylase gamma subunit